MVAVKNAWPQFKRSRDNQWWKIRFGWDKTSEFGVKEFFSYLKILESQIELHGPDDHLSVELWWFYVYLNQEVLDFVLNESKRQLGAVLKRHIVEGITEKDCSRGIVHLLMEIFAKILNDPQLESICGQNCRKDLEKFIAVKLYW